MSMRVRTGGIALLRRAGYGVDRIRRENHLGRSAAHPIDPRKSL